MPGATIDADAVRAHVRENLARYKVPRDVVFVEHLPRNPTGKVLKRALAELAVDLCLRPGERLRQTVAGTRPTGARRRCTGMPSAGPIVGC